MAHVGPLNAQKTKNIIFSAGVFKQLNHITTCFKPTWYDRHPPPHMYLKNLSSSFWIQVYVRYVISEWKSFYFLNPMHLVFKKNILSISEWKSFYFLNPMHLVFKKNILRKFCNIAKLVPLYVVVRGLAMGQELIKTVMV